MAKKEVDVAEEYKYVPENQHVKLVWVEYDSCCREVIGWSVGRSEWLYSQDE